MTMFEECENAFNDYLAVDTFRCGFRAAWEIQQAKIEELTRVLNKVTQVNDVNEVPPPPSIW